jgi:hypothetical protein
MLINLSNHPYENWDIKQKQFARELFNQVIDLPFPEIDPLSNITAINNLAFEFLEKCKKLLKKEEDKQNAIHISGEPCFLFQFVTHAKEINLICVCSTTRRIVTNIDNIKTSVFQFEQFRSYF